MTTRMTKAQLQAKIEELETQIAARDARIAQLNARIAALEAPSTTQQLSTLPSGMPPLAAFKYLKRHYGDDLTFAKVHGDRVEYSVDNGPREVYMG